MIICLTVVVGGAAIAVIRKHSQCLPGFAKHGLQCVPDSCFDGCSLHGTCQYIDLTGAF